MEAERRFESFRVTREPAHLGAVFDLVADDLFAVALHLCADHMAAEDLVQATFLTAIERADRYDPARPLRPWLLGILHRESKRERRRARRSPARERLDARREPEPIERALDAETTVAVQHAIAAMPAPYREVLELRLLQALPNGQIAARLRRSPGVVRTQLWRALQMLRNLLPKGLACTVVTQLVGQPSLIAVRARVLAAATPAKSGAVGVAVVAGAVLMKKILFAAVVVVAGLGVAWSNLGGGPTEPARGEIPSGSTAAIDTAAVASAPVEVPPAGERTPLATPREPAVASVDAPTPTAPYDVRVLVVDPAGDPVPDAHLEVFPAAWQTTERGESIPWDVRGPEPAVLERRTDQTGRCAVRLDCAACFLHVRKDGVGSTGDLLVRAGMSRLAAEWRLVLLRPVRVTGVVLGSDGAPAAGASVTAHRNGGPTWDEAAAPRGVEADGAGRFALEFAPGSSYWVRARLGARFSAGAAVETNRPRDHEVTLRFAGGYSVSGVLRDGEDRAVVGRLWVLSSAGDPSRHESQAKSLPDGTYEVLLTEPGSYRVIGGADGWSAEQGTVHLDVARPHQRLDLRLRPRVRVAGRVVDERGEPCAGVFVGFGYVEPNSRVRQCIGDLNGGLPRGLTAADGTFEFQAPAGCRYSLSYRPMPHLRVTGPEFLPPVENLVLVLRESDKQGFTLAGRVFAVATGAPVPGFTVYLMTHGSKGGASDQRIAQCEDVAGTFRVGPFMPGRRYSLRVEAAGLAPAEVGPFDATVRQQDVEVGLAALGRLRVEVVRADGKPAIQTRVSLQRLGQHPFARAHQGLTDEVGAIAFTDVTPDRYRVWVVPLGDDDAAATNTEVEVLPGVAPTHRVTLQR